MMPLGICQAGDPSYHHLSWQIVGLQSSDGNLLCLTDTWNIAYELADPLLASGAGWTYVETISVSSCGFRDVELVGSGLRSFVCAL